MHTQVHIHTHVHTHMYTCTHHSGHLWGRGDNPIAEAVPPGRAALMQMFEAGIWVVPRDNAAAVRFRAGSVLGCSFVPPQGADLMSPAGLASILQQLCWYRCFPGASLWAERCWHQISRSCWRLQPRAGSDPAAVELPRSLQSCEDGAFISAAAPAGSVPTLPSSSSSSVPPVTLCRP